MKNKIIIERIYPLTPMQESILLKTLTEPESSAYHLTLRIKADFMPAEEELEYALAKLLAKHEVLRTVIVHKNAPEPRQAVISGRDLPIRWIDFSAEQDPDSACAELEDRLFNEPIDLQKNPLFRVVCVKTGGNSCQLIFIVHHIIVDGWCNGIWLPDFAKFLMEAVEHKEKKEDFADRKGRFERHVRDILSRSTDEAKRYWEALFTGYEAYAEIPASRVVTDKNRADRTVSDRTVADRNELHFELSCDDTAALVSLCRSSGCTLNNAAEAALGLLLQKYEGTTVADRTVADRTVVDRTVVDRTVVDRTVVDRTVLDRNDTAFIKVVSGRDHTKEDVSDIVGIFINSVPVRVQTEHDESVCELLQKMQKQSAETSMYDWLPLADIKSVTHLKHCSVIFAYENYETSQLSPHFMLLSTKETNVSDITIGAYTADGRLHVGIQFDTGKYTYKRMQGFAESFKNILAGLTKCEKISQLSIMTEESRRLIDNINDTAIDIPFVPVHRQIHDQAVKNPNKPAVITRTKTLSFRELDLLSNRVAEYIIKNAPAHSIVGILLDRTVWAYVAEIAVLKAGCAFMPLSYPKERIDFCVKDTGSNFIITHDTLTEIFGTDDLSRVAPDARYNEMPDIDILRDDAAYCIYTSGSTGTPKGVLIEHGNISNYVNRNEKSPEIMLFAKRGRVSFATASLSFDFAIGESFPPLCNGNTVYLASEEEIKNPQLFAEAVLSNGVNEIACTPAYIAGLLDIPEAEAALKQIELFDIGAESFPHGLYKRLRALRSDSIIMNDYGPTECTISCAAAVITDEDNISVGRPMANTEFHIVDEYGNELPTGARGELIICGAGVARGYVKAHEKDGFFVYRGKKAYRSGDVAEWTEDGNVRILGRRDNQVKLRGFRIELGEIENAMVQFHGIKSALVVKTTNLIGYYIAGEEIDEAALKQVLEKTLPEYMVPDAFVRMEAFPLTANGKIDRAALPAPELKAEEIIPPANEFERQAFAVAAKLLETDKFGVTTNLISVGLNSIRAMRLAIAVSKATGTTIRTGDILAHPRIRDWQEIHEQINADKIAVLPPREIYPLTPNQLGIYLDCEQNRERLQYNVPFAWRFAEIDTEKLRHALEKVINAHPYLKVHIEERNGSLIQVRRDNAALPVLFRQLDSEPGPDFLQSRVRPFDLLNQDLARFEIYKTPEATYLFTDIHHIIYDGISADILLRDLEKAYNGDTLKPEAANAYDYSLFFEQWKASDHYAEAEKYFTGLIAGTESFLYPPLHSNSVPSGESAVYNISSPSEPVRSCCRALGITENAFFAAVFSQVFHRVGRLETVQFATVSNGRSCAQLENTIGMFVQTLPLVSKTAEGKVGDVLKAMQSQIASTLGNDLFPYTVLADKYHVKPNFFYVWQGDIISSDNELRQNIPLSLNTVKIPLVVNIIPDHDSYVFLYEYDAGLYSTEDIKALAGAVVNFADALASAPADAEIKTVSMVSEEEKQRLIALGTGEELCYDSTQTLVDLFLKNAHENPQNSAVVDSVSSITYGELNRRSDVMAHELIALGVKPNDFVAIRLPRIKEFIISVIAVWKAGAAHVPLDLEYPQERIDYMLMDSGAKVIIDEGFIAQIDFEKAAVPLNMAEPDNIAYMIYTSGSTGHPKGVVVPHRALMSFTVWHVDLVRAKPGDAMALFLSFCCDGSFDDFATSVAAGATLHILDENVRKDLSAIHRYLSEHNICGLDLIAPVGMMLLNEYQDLNLRFLVVAGDKLNPVKNTSVHLINEYGPTEFTVTSSYHIVNQELDGENIPIGRPVPNSILAIVDSAGNLMPRGIAGELALSGEQIAMGYWNQPELTDRKFVEAPFLNQQKMYLTGDLACWNEKGELLYLGRADNQIKLRGFRIELGEIESAIAKFPGVAAVAADVKTINNTQHLTAYYVSACGISEYALKAELAKTLPEYMIPDIFVRLDTMPMAPNGKLDRKALPVPELEAEEIIPPANQFERQAFAVAAEVLGTDKFGVTTDLISMGLTSIRAIRLSIALSRAAGLTVRTGDMLAHPRIRDWQNIAKEEDPEKIAILPPREIYPLTANQLGVYLDWEQNKNGVQYNMPAVLKPKNADAEKLYQAVKKVIAAHPYLKVHFKETESGIMQVRRDDAEPSVLFKHLNCEPDAEYFAARVQPFDLLQDNPARFEVYETPRNAYLFIDIHHIIYDGMASAVLLADLENAYENAPMLCEAATAYDYALFYENWLKSERYQTCEKYFDSLVAETESFMYPPVRSSSVPSGEAGNYDAAMPMHNIRSRCRALGITENAFFAAALCQVFHRTGRNDAVQIAAISSGRSRAQLENTIGMFVQTLPLVSRTDSGSVSDILRTMHNQLVSTLKNDMFPYTALVEKYHIKPNVLYAWQADVDAIGRNLFEVQAPFMPHTAKFPLSLGISPEGDTYHLYFEYDAGLYTAEEIEALGRAVINFAEALAEASDDTEISTLSMVSEEEAAGLIDLGSADKLEYDPSETFIDIFRAQVRRTPNARAVVDTAGTLSYAELDKRSDIIARKLTEQGVAPGDFAAIMLPSCKEFVICIIGVWKAGAAYVPVDPEYPQERISHMLENSCAKITIDEAYIAGIDFAEDCEPMPAAPAVPDNPAYMMYTSGSTGRPKGVVITYANICAFAAWRVPESLVLPGEGLIQTASFSFDMSVDDLITTLPVGASLHILDEATKHNLNVLYDYIKKEHIVGLALPPQLGRTLINEYNDLPLRYLMMGGEKFQRTRPTPVLLSNGYGPTEFTICSTYHFIDQEHDGEDIPIGRPVRNSIAAIIDTKGQLLPRGMAGELALIGPQIAQGYWHLPELTAEKFVVSPFMPEHKMYKTGDMACWCRAERAKKGGELMFLGRIDNQVKLRGFRIELGETENALLKFAGIKAAAAEIKTINNIQHLVGYYVSECEIDASALRAELGKALAEYMIPDIFVCLEKLPLTPNGKLDRKALPVPEFKADEIVAPENDFERAAMAAAAELLGTDKFGVTTNLISMGLTSLRAIRLSIAISKATGATVRTGDILAHPRIRDWNTFAAAQKKQDDIIRHIESLPARTAYPLTDTQLDIYRIWQQNRDRLQYDVASALKFTDADPRKLQRAVEKVIAAHPYFKVHFAEQDGKVIQLRRDDAELPVNFEHIDFTPNAEFFRSHLKPFDLLNDDLARFDIYEAPDAVYLFMDVHHIIYDGSAENAFLSALKRAYSGEEPEKEAVNSYDYALFYENWLKSGQYAECEKYFADLIKGTKPFTYPAEGGKPAAPAHRLAGYIAEIPSSAIRTRCRALGITESTFFAAVLCQLFHKISGSDTVQIAALFSGRSAEQLSNTVGMFACPLPLVSREAHGNAADILQAMQKQFSATMKHELFPYNALAEKYKCRADVLYVCQTDVISEENVFAPSDIYPLSPDTATLPLCVSVVPCKESYTITLEYDADIYGKEEMKTLSQNIIDMANALATPSRFSV